MAVHKGFQKLEKPQGEAGEKPEETGWGETASEAPRSMSTDPEAPLARKEKQKARPSQAERFVSRAIDVTW